MKELSNEECLTDQESLEAVLDANDAFQLVGIEVDAFATMVDDEKKDGESLGIEDGNASSSTLGDAELL